MLLLTAEAHHDALPEVVLLGTTRLLAPDAGAATSGSESPPFQIPETSQFRGLSKWNGVLGVKNTILTIRNPHNSFDNYLYRPLL